MKHTAIAQASPDIAPEGVFNTMAGRMQREGYGRDGGGQGQPGGLDQDTGDHLSHHGISALKRLFR